MERVAGRRVDRWIAVTAFGVAAVVLLTIASTADAPELARLKRDPQAATDLVRLMQRGEGGDHIVDYAFTRSRLGGARLPANITEGRWKNVSIDRGGDALDLVLPKTTYRCERVATVPSCFTHPTVPSLAQSAVFATAVEVGAYDVTRLDDEQIAGERARCFRVRAPKLNRQLPEIGRETQLCLAFDGIELRHRTDNGSSVDERVAARVRRNVGRAAIPQLLAGFEQAAAKPGR